MTSKRVLPFVIPIVIALVFVGVKSWGFGGGNSEPATRYEKILTTVADLLEQGHYNPKKLDDKFSQEVFRKYLNDIDPDKNLLLQEDVNALKQYELTIDNELRTGKSELVPAVEAIYKKRLEEAAAIYKELLSKPFDFSKNETAHLDGEKLPFAKDAADRKDAWRKRLKYMVLDRYAFAIETRETSKDTVKNFVYKADSTLERESRERVLKIMDRSFDRLRNKFSLDEKFNMYINDITSTMDPHTNFFPPVEKRAFDEQMSGRFYGIGAQLGEQDGTIKIVSVITGSPAWKSGEIQVNDIIMKVGQGDAEPIDITGFETEDAVKVIRGKKGTEVRLTLKKVDGSIKVVSLIRDEIVQEETFARSAIVNKGGNKIGYIFLPEFYADFENPNGARSARDVAKEVQKLKDEHVNGIVIDLRNNGGGSLQDVIQMVGLFIDAGPVVQVKDRDGEASVYQDKDKGILYDGPLAVMINEFSASASEIFAAAIQDYKRGVVVGTPSYGKGTVQRNVGLDRNTGFFMPASELGTLKLTLQKFYRIDGGSTQLRGVTPDVIVPDNYEFYKFREKDNPDALPWDEIKKATFNQWNSGYDLKGVEVASQKRIETSPVFTGIRSNAQWLATENDKVFNLGLVQYQQDQKALKEKVKQTEKLLTLGTPAEIAFMNGDEERINQMDKMKAERFRNWLKALKTDIYLDETTNIMNDMILQGKTAKK